MKYTLNVTNETAELVLDGAVTVENAQVLLNSLTDPDVAVAELCVNMSAVREIDLTGLQLLCAAHHSATKEGKKLRLTNVNHATIDSMDSLGFIRHVGCLDDKSGSCLWIIK